MPHFPPTIGTFESQRNELIIEVSGRLAKLGRRMHTQQRGDSKIQEKRALKSLPYTLDPATFPGKHSERRIDRQNGSQIHDSPGVLPTKGGRPETFQRRLHTTRRAIHAAP